MEKMNEKNMINDQELEEIAGGDKFWNWIKKMEKEEKKSGEIASFDNEMSILVTNDFSTEFDPKA